LYLPRTADRLLQDALDVVGGVIIEGPRYCGKTTTAKQFATSAVELDKETGIRLVAQADPATLLDGKTPRLIDEWQLVPAVWNVVRHEIDKRNAAGQFILTGSAVPSDDITRHSGAGRFVRLEMETMTLAEMGHSSADVSLAALFDGEREVAAIGGPTVAEYVDIMFRGGWPGLQGSSEKGASLVLRNYVDETARVDINIPNGMQHDPKRVESIIRSLARNTANEFPNSRLAAESADGGNQLAEQTVRNYLDALRRIHILKDQPGWNTHLRSRVRLISNPKRHLADPSIALAALGASAKTLLGDGEALGFFFESQVVHDLRVFGAMLDGEVFHYRDSSGLEIDAIVELRDLRWAGIEVKMPQDAIDVAAANLLACKAKLAESVAARCAFLAVITSGQASYRRSDGVYVISLGHLGP
jgi:predicted AAA+ superfamily ATPase